MSKKEDVFTKKYSWIMIISFFGILAGLTVSAVLMPDKELSKEERRHYEQSPKLTWENVMDGSYMTDLEDYLLDQFVMRDWFRTLKTEVEVMFLGKTDANDYVKIEDDIYQLDTDWKEENVIRAAKEFAALQKDAFAGADVYYALIPDKSYFLPEGRYPVSDDTWTIEQMQTQLVDATYVDLYPYLTIDDYYKTDLHWKQESIGDVACALMQAMQTDADVSVLDKETEIQLITSEFYGGYAGGSAYDVAPDELYAVTNDVIENALVYDYEKEQYVTVYAPDKLEEMDPYDYYLWGARALLTIQNPSCDNGEKLIVFRDSFGSSIAPLLIEQYEEITLVDLRYISAAYAKEILALDEYDDVLFLYSQRVLRHSDSLRF